MTCAEGDVAPEALKRIVCRQGDLGPASIIEVATAGSVPHPPYAELRVATKSAVSALALVAAKGFAARGTRVNAIAAP
ncbi:hypothetical protein GCM10010185_55300 [Saccharothrix coeruleofusca]|uniref:Uncharacterized protein n=1 Tax=Saccharothrix coeruleofusca TaxID=33919 RepID=A0A918EGW5_9PSEU|nr:hypothetical protein [Saccharothrix coeruleofusca]MBP2334726.1 NAD(P)-dependent dehydrogenase (short-subunit alcohol dehydrogenase family) [Saccharothrix coeruleofusca]GGP74609.1 hypothetical protein GCM10010185_55300 [Saccharothrix coeruleofusca]